MNNSRVYQHDQPWSKSDVRTWN